MPNKLKQAECCRFGYYQMSNGKNTVVLVNKALVNIAYMHKVTNNCCTIKVHT